MKRIPPRPAPWAGILREGVPLGPTPVATKAIGCLGFLRRFLHDKLHLAEIVERLLPTPRRRDALPNGIVVEWMVMSRLKDPQRLYHMATWAEEQGFEALTGYPADKLNDDRIRRVREKLPAIGRELQRHLAERVRTLYEQITGARVSSDLILDSSSSYLEGAYEESELAQPGYSREGRPDAKQVTWGLAVTAEGLVQQGRVQPGNTNDATATRAWLADLKEDLQPTTLIGDRLILCDKNLAAFRRQGVGYLGAVETTRAREEVLLRVPTWETLTYRGEAIRVADVTFPIEVDGEAWEQRGVVVYSPLKAEEDRRQRHKDRRRVEERLAKVQAWIDRLRVKPTAERVQERVAQAFRGRYRYLQPLYEFIYPNDPQTRISQLVYTIRRAERDRLRRLDGMFLLVTDQPPDVLSAQEVFHRYKLRHVVEIAIKFLKQRLRVRPLWLHTDDRIAGLMIINFLAAMVYTLIHLVAGQKVTGMAENTAAQVLAAFSPVTLVIWAQPDGSLRWQMANTTPLQRHIENIFLLAT